MNIARSAITHSLADPHPLVGGDRALLAHHRLRADLDDALVAADLGPVADPDEAAEADLAARLDLQFQPAAEEEGPVGAPAPAGGGQQAPPEVAPEEPRVARVQHPVAGQEAEHGGATLDWRRALADVAKSAPLAERLLAGEKRALARAITLIESDDPAGWDLVREVYPRTGKARIVGFTGPPGVGKSTLIGALTGELRKAEREVAVLSIDPSSPFTRGALLGDRIRLTDHFLDPGVFIRSMASRGALGGLSEAALQVALIMDAAGKDDVLIETVGVGQAEIDIVDHADTIVLALMPGSGDSIQALKAGVMEIPDVIVVNKADHPMTDTMVREVRGVLALSHDPEGWKVPILRTEAARGEGVDELAAKIDEHRALHRAAGDAGRAPRPQPAQRGARHRHLADAPPPRADRLRGPGDGGAARPGGAARTRPGHGGERAAGEARR